MKIEIAGEDETKTTLHRVGDIADQIRGVTYRKQDASTSPAAGFLPVLRAGNITDEGLTYNDLVYVPSSKISAKQMVRKDDIVIAASSGSINIVGKAARALEDFEGGFGAFCKILRPNKNVNPAYFSHFFKTTEYRRKVSFLAEGASINNLRNEDLNGLQVPLPPLTEQKRIAKILDATDALRAKRHEALAQLDSLLQSTFLDIFGDPVTNPKGWEECTVGDVTDCIVPGRDKPKSFTGSIPWITTDDLIDLAVTSKSSKTIGLSSKEIATVRARIIPQGSVIISCVGNLGISSLAGRDMVVNQQLHTFQCGGKITAEFLMFYLPFRKPWMIRRATQTTLPYLNKTNCNSIPIFIPPLTLQTKFATIVKSIEQQKARMQAHLTELDTLFAALQQRAFNGEL